MTRDPQKEDFKRRDAQWTAQFAMQLALDQDDMQCAEKLWDMVCDYTAARVTSRKSGWLPLKGE